MRKNCHILPNCAPKRFSISASLTLAEFSIFLYFCWHFCYSFKTFHLLSKCISPLEYASLITKASDFFFFDLLFLILYWLYFIFWILDGLTSGALILKGMTLPKTACSVASVVSNSLWRYGCSPPGSSVHWILQARMLVMVAMPSSRGSSQPRNSACVSYVSCIGRWVLYH